MEPEQKTAPLLTFQEWMAQGVLLGFCSDVVCDTHDGLPSTEEEQEAWDDGYDPCVPAVRLYP